MCKQVILKMQYRFSESQVEPRSDQFSSVAQSYLTLCDPHGLPCPSPTPRECSNSCVSSWWCHPTISSSVVPFSSCLQSFPGLGSFPMSQRFFQWVSCSHQMTKNTGIPGSASNWNTSNEYSGLISLKIDWFDDLAVQETLRNVV